MNCPRKFSLKCFNSHNIIHFVNWKKIRNIACFPPFCVFIFKLLYLFWNNHPKMLIVDNKMLLKTSLLTDYTHLILLKCDIQHNLTPLCFENRTSVRQKWFFRCHLHDIYFGPVCNMNVIVIISEYDYDFINLIFSFKPVRFG